MTIKKQIYGLIVLHYGDIKPSFVFTETKEKHEAQITESLKRRFELETIQAFVLQEEFVKQRVWERVGHNAPPDV